MTQVQSSGAGWAKAALGAAIAALGFAVGYAVNRGSETAPAAAPEMTASDLAGASVATLEMRAKDNPGDGEAWAALGAAYSDAGRFKDAITAYEKATSTMPNLASLWSALGEARVMANERDNMPTEAAANFAKAASLDPKDPRARYFLAMKKNLDGDHNGAVKDWLALLTDTPLGAPWETDLRQTIEQVAKANGIEVSADLAAIKPSAPNMPVAANGIPGPSLADMQAAASIPPEEQRMMAEGMVSRLEGRLKANPKNIDGWIMLMRSRVTLDQPGKASKALMDAVAANPDKADMLHREAAMLGVK